MSTVRCLVLLVVAAALALAGCGSDQASPGAGPATSSPTDGPSPTAADGPTAVSLTLVASGGLAGVERVVEIRPGTPGAEQILGRAARLDGGQGVPPHREIPCCDLLRYALEVRLADGSTTRAVTYDGDDSPAYAVVRAVQRLSGRAPGAN